MSLLNETEKYIESMDKTCNRLLELTGTSITDILEPISDEKTGSIYGVCIKFYKDTLDYIFSVAKEWDELCKKVRDIDEKNDSLTIMTRSNGRDLNLILGGIEQLKCEIEDLRMEIEDMKKQDTEENE